jgi:DNA-binding MarR family transcriptional regulator
MIRQTSTAADLAATLMRLTRLVRAPAHSSALNPAQWDALRYLAAANRFSRYPAELTAFMGSTKGTVSQTLMALEQKGLVAKARDADNARRVKLELTRDGRQALKGDPTRLIERAARKIEARQSDDVVKSLTLLADALTPKGATRFAGCAGCKYFNKAKGKKTPNCALFDTALAIPETVQLCAYHTPK